MRPGRSTFWWRVKTRTWRSKSLNRLPEKQRKVLVLYEMEELSAIEIAELLDTKVSTIRVVLFRARARFLAELRLAERHTNDEKENEP